MVGVWDSPGRRRYWVTPESTLATRSLLERAEEKREEVRPACEVSFEEADRDDKSSEERRDDNCDRMVDVNSDECKGEICPWKCGSELVE